MHEIELVLGLLVAVAVLVTLARKIQVPYPILLTLGGLALSLVPGLPRIELEPEVVLLLLLPPILFSAAFFTSIRDLKANIRPIALLSVGLVLFTMVIVAVVAYQVVPELTWPAAFALGAIVAPPDAVAATAIAQRLGVPRRLVTLLEGESLLNDATALVALRMAIVAAITGSFSVSEATVRFVFVALGGIAIGLVVGWGVIWMWSRLEDPPVEILISLLAPFAAFLPAEQLGVSGVLAAVTAGLYVGRRSARALDSEARISGRAVWQMLVFLINGLIFILVGLQMSWILEHLTGWSTWTLVSIGVLVSLAAIVARIVWIYPATYLPRLIPAVRRDDPAPPWQIPTILAWAGPRGGVSLAAALALPRALPDGTPFPARDLIIFLTFCVILATLVGQGLTLPLLIRRLGVGEDGSAAYEEMHARAAAAEAAVQRIEQLAEEWPDHMPLVETLRTQYAHRSSHIGNGSRDDEDGHEPGAEEQELLEHRIIRRSVIDAEREAIIGLRDTGVINDEVLHRIERDLDLEELRMEA